MSTSEPNSLPHRPVLGKKETPWRRTGYPGLINSNHVWGHAVVNVGSNPHRVLDDDALIDYCARYGGVSVGHLEERAFAHLWDYENNGLSNHGTYGLMWQLLDQTGKDLVKDEDDLLLLQLAAATFAQWLGTNVGRSFIEGARRLTNSEAKRLLPDIEKRRKLLQAIGEVAIDNHEIRGVAGK